MEQIKQSEDGMRQTVLLIKIGLMVFLTFACCTVFFFLVLRYKGVADTWHLITGALQPIIIGLGLAYLLNPVMKFQERHWLPFLKKKMKSEKSAAKVARGLSIAGAILFLLVILVLLIAAIVPSVVSSVTGLVEALPGNVESLIHMVKSGKLGAYGVTDTISDMLTKLTDQVENWATKDLLPQMQQYLLQITSGVITMVKSILNFIIGIIVVVYVLSIKESLVGQSKKIVYAIFKPKHGNIIIEVFHKADEVFGGFIIGKIIDSAIIGVICYFGCLILHIPVGYLWKYILSASDFGFVNQLLRGIGLQSVNFLGSGKLALGSIIFTQVWQWFGWSMVIYLGNLQSISEDLYEAASIDGANTLRKFWHITIPGLAPAIKINLVTGMISGLKVFDVVLAMTNGGPAHKTDTILLMMFSRFSDGNYGYASAFGIIFLVVSMLLSAVLLGLFGKWERRLGQ